MPVQRSWPPTVRDFRPVSACWLATQTQRFHRQTGSAPCFAQSPAFGRTGELRRWAAARILTSARQERAPCKTCGDHVRACAHRLAHSQVSGCAAVGEPLVQVQLAHLRFLCSCSARGLWSALGRRPPQTTQLLRACVINSPSSDRAARTAAAGSKMKCMQPDIQGATAPNAAMRQISCSAYILLSTLALPCIVARFPAAM